MSCTDSRTKKTDGTTTTTFTWDNVTGSLPLILEMSGRSIIYGPDELPLAQIETNDDTLYYHHDQLGSTRLITDEAGDVEASYTYSAYGELTGSIGTTDVPFGYAGQYTDVETGFQYLRARYYDPNTAQFTSVDPVVDETWTPYAYTFGNPIDYNDPSGEVAPAVVVGGLAVGRIAVPLLAGALGIGGATVVGKKVWQTETVNGSERCVPSITQARKNADGNPKPDKRLSDQEVKKYQDAGLLDAHRRGEKLGKSRDEYYKKPNGDIVVKPKSGRGDGDPTGVKCQRPLPKEKMTASSDERSHPIVSVSLGLRSASWAPDEISRLTGLVPTQTACAGEKPTTIERTFERNLWVIQVGPEPVLDLEPLCDQLLAVLDPAWSRVVELCSKTSIVAGVEVVVELTSSLAPGFLLSSSFVARCAELGAALDIDIWTYGLTASQ